MIFCVFSFNRGKYLENCINSIERCAPDHPIIIIDDNSDDAETILVLDKYRHQYRVIQPVSSAQGRHHLGGLYGNMELAYEVCRSESLVCYLQDDTQVVRGLSAEDIADIEDTFDRAPELAFINPCFIRGINLTRGAEYRYDEQLKLYFREESERSSGTYFSALLIMKPARLLAKGWSFRASEPTNNKAAAEMFLPMGYQYSPFAMWLPEVPAYRGKRKTLGLKIAERKRNCGYYPFATLSSEETKALKSRNPEVLPVAEDFLRCQYNNDPPKPWAYNPLTNTGWIKTLNQIEVSIRRLIK